MPKVEPKAEAYPRKKHKVMVKIDEDENAAAGRISWCFYVSRGVGVMSGTSAEMFLTTVEFLAELFVEDLGTLKCLFTMTSAGLHIVRHRGMLEREEMIRALPVNRLPDPLPHIASSIRRQFGKPPK